MAVKLKASTLIESIIAMVVVSVVFVVAMMTIGWGINAGQSPQITQANALIKNIGDQTESERRFFDESIELDGFVIEKTVTSENAANDLFRLKISVFNSEMELVKTQNRMIYVR